MLVHLFIYFFCIHFFISGLFSATVICVMWPEDQTLEAHVQLPELWGHYLCMYLPMCKEQLHVQGLIKLLKNIPVVASECMCLHIYTGQMAACVKSYQALEYPFSFSKHNHVFMFLQKNRCMRKLSLNSRRTSEFWQAHACIYVYAGKQLHNQKITRL